MSVCTARRWKVSYAKKFRTPFSSAAQGRVGCRHPRKKSADEVPACDEALFEYLVRKGFSERRKQLRKLLPEYRELWPEACAALGLPETVRAEDCHYNSGKSSRKWSLQRGRKAVTKSLTSWTNLIASSGSETRNTVHVNNFRHRAVHMLDFQTRPESSSCKSARSGKDKNPGVWDSSAAGHVDAGKPTTERRNARSSRKLGIRIPLEKFGHLGCSAETGFEFIELYSGTHDGPFVLPRMELETGAFFSRCRSTENGWRERRRTSAPSPAGAGGLMTAQRGGCRIIDGPTGHSFSVPGLFGFRSRLPCAPGCLEACLRSGHARFSSSKSPDFGKEARSCILSGKSRCSKVQPHAVKHLLSPTPRPTTALMQKLWLAAYKLRNNMDAAEYKHVVLGNGSMSSNQSGAGDIRKTLIEMANLVDCMVALHPVC